MNKFKVDKRDTKKISGIKNTIALLKKTKIKKSVYFKIFILYFISGIMAVLSAFFTTKITEKITQAEFDYFITIVILLSVIMFLKMTFQNLQYIFNVRLENMIVKAINTENYKRVLDLEVVNFDKYSSEEFQNRIYAANQISSVIIKVFTSLYEIVHNLAYSIIIFIYAPIVCLIYCIYPVFKIIYLKIMNPKINTLYLRNWKENGIKMTALSREAIIGIKDIKSLNIQNQIMKDYYSKQTNYYNRQNEINTYSIKMNFLRAIVVCIRTLATFIAGYYLYLNNMLTIVAFIMFLSYKGYIDALFDQFSMLISSVSNVEANALKGHELYDEALFGLEKFGTTDLQISKGEIEIKNLTFRYNKKQKLFQNVNLHIKPNEITAIVGRSGEGKSTILSLINKFYQVRDNTIFLNGVDINKLSKKSIRSNITYIQQSPYIFNMTFRENLLLINPQATEKQLIAACKKSEIYDFIKSTAEGLDTVIGENGITLSGGQKQRFAIARALLNDSKIIMFDESTSSLDNESQYKIQKVIEGLKKRSYHYCSCTQVKHYH